MLKSTLSIYQTPYLSASRHVVQTAILGTNTDALGNKQFAVVRLLSSPSLSTREALAQGQVELYPNPATQQLTLHLTGVADTQPLHVKVLDVLGREVLALPATHLVSGRVELVVQALRTGSYTLRVQGKDFTATRHFVRAN
ncbi:T9SS type A sorting domain-containing protein [Hymenobacter metallicola]|uniref:T9SS type A sorting domain-containing protein n=1 Tax=Hymenobacter metallicola TaxID=2563114 RepID=UPI0014369D42|nr:T9SS type A sorting domain-containing protein [Hymenobacter metallicola]